MRREDRSRGHLAEYKRAFNENTMMTNHENAAETVKIPMEDWLAWPYRRTRRSCHLFARSATRAPVSNLWTLAEERDLGMLLRRQGHSLTQKAQGCCWP